ncbi:tyrosine-protein kinase receptor TYRO3-like isoform X2 [Branchiostoma floridae]|nr:tyrosine-protein kinase receptor TYRO3-like isoform X2 [Branchiostoma floridae]
MDLEPVMVFLQEKGSLTVDETAGVRAAPCVVERLLEILCVLKGDQASRVLSNALRHSDQTHLADLLDGKVLPDARCITIATITETSIGITFKPAYKNLQHFGDVDKYLVKLELATPEPKTIMETTIRASDLLQATFSGLVEGTSYNITVISKRGDVSSAGFTLTTTTIGKPILLQSITDKERSELLQVQIYKKEITLHEDLGKGNFGEVRRGIYRKGKEKVQCAVKTLFDPNKESEMVSLLREGLRMNNFDHDNVLKLIGICVHGNEAMIVLPYMQHGDLRKYLQVTKEQSLLENLHLCLDIARGMAYLSDNDIVHRDLAARNCMLDENLRVKVADFGLCRDIHKKGYYRIKNKELNLPIRWLAPESFAEHKFDTKTDIWSYGIVLWEIFTAGQTPYPFMDHHHHYEEPANILSNKLKEGYRMDKPNRCPVTMYEIMGQCWKDNPEERPNFKEVLNNVKQIHKSFKYQPEYKNYNVQQLHGYETMLTVEDPGRTPELQGSPE